jgi:uncharacterized protein (DUF433 family)
MSNRTQLLDAIATLPDGLVDQTLLYVQGLQEPVQVTPGICGGHARIRNTRIPIWTLIAYHQQGATDEELLANYPGLTVTDLQVAWAYYEQHQDEIDRAIDDDE